MEVTKELSKLMSASKKLVSQLRLIVFNYSSSVSRVFTSKYLLNLFIADLCLVLETTRMLKSQKQNPAKTEKKVN